MPGVKSIAMGYKRAHKRLQEAYSQAYALHPDKTLDESTAEKIRIELFETLNWLDALRLSPEGGARIDPDLADALRFVRGVVHHTFADAIEFRRDVLLHLRPTMPGKSGPSGPLPVADWLLARDRGHRRQAELERQLEEELRRGGVRRSPLRPAGEPCSRPGRLARRRGLRCEPGYALSTSAITSTACSSLVGEACA